MKLICIIQLGIYLRLTCSQSENIRKNASISVLIPISSYSETIGTNGSFNFSYETGNGIQVSEEGYLKKLNLSYQQVNEGNITSAQEEEETEGQVIKGSFSYTAPDGTIISLKYIADENGFQPEGEHLPITPNPSRTAWDIIYKSDKSNKQEQ